MPGQETTRQSTRADLRWPSIADLLDEAARDYGDAPAVVQGAIRLSFGDLRARALALATRLAREGIGPGDRVAICAPNSWEWIVTALAIQLRGAALVPISTRLRERDLGMVLALARPAMIFIERDFLGIDYRDLVLRAASAAPIRIIPFDAEEGGGASFQDWLGTPAEAASVARDTGNGTIADIIFTSGTTGAPKGVMCRRAANFRGYHDFGAACGIRHGDRFAIVSPFSHSFGYKAGWLMALMFGACAYPVRTYDVQALSSLIAAEAITVLPGPPAIYAGLLADRPARFASLRVAVTGGASISPDLIRRMRDDLGLKRIHTAYALTESTAVATITRDGDDEVTIARTSGRALPDVELRIVGDDRHPVPQGATGRIQIRGYNVMAGYLDRPDLTAAAVSADGWLDTGDDGALDTRGNLQVVGRRGDMIIVGGFNVYPAETEALLTEHQAIADAAVVGRDDPRLGQVCVAFVVPADRSAGVDGEALRDWLRQKIAGYKVPVAIFPVDDLPRNAAGKVRYADLRQRLKEEGAGPWRMDRA